MTANQSTALYIHIPFCRLKCSYCDFNTYAGMDALIPIYVDAICDEIRHYQGDSEIYIETIFFGGGTPSLLSSELLTKIFTSINRTFKLQSDLEITLEANPGTLTKPYLDSLISLGFNRISIGAQSAITDELQLLDRLHTFNHVIESFKYATSAGFHQINLDLLYGLPNQTESSWQDTLSQVVDLRPQHLSLYALSLENGTPMLARASSGTIPTPDQDTVTNMYEHAETFLALHNYTQYEVCNWTKTSNYHECQHNLQYWLNLPYIGIGAGAHSWYKQHRYTNTKLPYHYIQRINSNPDKHPLATHPGTQATIQSTLIDDETEMNETMMLGLHLLVNGVSYRDFEKRFGTKLEHQYKRTLSHLEDKGLIQIGSTNVRLTSSGRLLANRVFSEFV